MIHDVITTYHHEMQALLERWEWCIPRAAFVLSLLDPEAEAFQAKGSPPRILSLRCLDLDPCLLRVEELARLEAAQRCRIYTPAQAKLVALRLYELQLLARPVTLYVHGGAAVSCSVSLAAAVRWWWNGQSLARTELPLNGWVFYLTLEALMQNLPSTRRWE